MTWPIAIAGSGTVTAVGLSSAETAASVRAGISRIREVELQDKAGSPYRAGFLAPEYLEERHHRLKDVAPDSLQERLLRLASSALRQAAGALDEAAEPPAVILGIGSEAQLGGGTAAALLENLSRQAQVRLDLAASRIIAGGRTAGLLAILEACKRLAVPGAPPVLAGGVDTFRDYPRLLDLDFDERILSEESPDGFLPGEGAGILLLSRPGHPWTPTIRAQLTAAAQGFEPGHLHAAEPMLGDGLSETLERLFAALPKGQPPCRGVLSNLNGESFGAKQWGIAALRNRRHLAEDATLHHPAEFFGDAGAAMGPILVAIGVEWLGRRVHAPPLLAWCAGDEGTCAAVHVAPGAEEASHARDR